MLASPLQARALLTGYLQTALPLKLTAVAQALMLPAGLIPPRTWVPLTAYFDVPEEQLPCVYVVIGNLTVIREWDDRFDIDLPARIVTVVAGRGRNESQDLATAYTDAVRYAMWADTTAAGAFQSARLGAQSDAGTDEANGQYRGSADLQLTFRAQLARDLPAADVVMPAGYPHLILPLDRLEP